MADFSVDPAFEAGSVFVADWPLCHVRLQDDARFPWLILIPRVPGATEIEDLSATDRASLMEEAVRAGTLVRALGAAFDCPVDKLNLAALGNVTAQLHLHVVAAAATIRSGPIRCGGGAARHPTASIWTGRWRCFRPEIARALI